MEKENSINYQWLLPGHVNDCYCSMTLQKSLREVLCTHKRKLQRQRNIPPALHALGEVRALTSNYYLPRYNRVNTKNKNI